MKALRIVAGDPARLELVQLPTPSPGPRQALVRIAAAGLNRADLLQLRGRYSVPADAPADIPGIEFAGVVEALGPDCASVTRGQRVFGLASGGAHAQYLVSPEELLVAVPSSLGDIEAGAVPEAFVTAHDALVSQAGMQSGERVLIHAIGSGVGLAGLQLADALGCQTYGTARTQSKVDAVAHLGTDPSRNLGFTYACLPDAFDEEILTHTQGAGVDVILDPVGAAYFERNMNVLATRGCLVFLSTMGGTTVTLQLPVLMQKRLKLIGTMLRNRAIIEKTAATRAFEHDVLPLLASRRIVPIVDRTYPFEQAAEAYKYMEDNRNFGKVVLTMA